MEDFALDGAAINGEANEWVTLEGGAVIALDALLAGIRGAGMRANGQVDLDCSAAMSAGIIGAGPIAVDLAISLQPSLLTRITGAMPISVDVAVAAALRAALAGAFSVAPGLNLDVTRWAMSQGGFDVTFGLTGEGRLVANIQIEGAMGIAVDPMLLDGRRTAAHRPSMPMIMSAAVEGPAALRMRGQGAATMQAVVEGIGRIGGKVSLAGTTSCEIITQGDARRYALVPVEGVADVQFLLMTDLAGRPALPAEYVPAPGARRFAVPHENRERKITSDRRL